MRPLLQLLHQLVRQRLPVLLVCVQVVRFIDDQEIPRVAFEQPSCRPALSARRVWKEATT